VRLIGDTAGDSQALSFLAAFTNNIDVETSRSLATPRLAEAEKKSDSASNYTNAKIRSRIVTGGNS
jgi:hypothetical protein